VYSLQDIKSVHLEVTSKCQAKCPMCPRNLQGSIVNPFITLDEVSIDQFKEWFSIDFITGLDNLSMCGNYGDPIIAKDTLEIFEYLREHNNQIQLKMHTNGSGRNNDWWTRLAKLNVHTIFGLDGLEDTHSLYRINTDFKKIIENARSFINAGGYARWDMLAFKHNEHQIEDCRSLSKKLGFREFTVKHTSRFRDGKLNVLDDTGKTTHILYPTTHSNSMIPKIKNAMEETLPEIHCKAKKDNSIYVSATGVITPCCWTEMSADVITSSLRTEFLDKIGSWPSLKQSTIEEIFSSGFFDKIKHTWSTCGIGVCSKQCGSFDKLSEQWKEEYK